MEKGPVTKAEALKIASYELRILEKSGSINNRTANKHFSDIQRKLDKLKGNAKLGLEDVENLSLEIVTKAGKELRGIVIKGWRKGKGAVHFTKHGQGLGYKTLKEYTDAAIAFAKKTGNIIESKVGNIIFKYDYDTEMILIVSAKERTLVTFYKADHGLDSFEEAMQDHWQTLLKQGHKR